MLVSYSDMCTTYISWDFVKNASAQATRPRLRVIAQGIWDEAQAAGFETAEDSDVV